MGKANNDIIILLHGGGLSWWNYIDEISLLENEFHIVIPILDGHSGSNTNFTSIESNALEIINFINKNYNGKVKLIGGLSLGGQILLEILSKNPNICECAIIESALVIPMDFTYKMIEPIFNLSYCLISKKWFSKLQFKSLKLKKSLFALYYEDTCKITKDNFEDYFGDADIDFKEAIVSEANINAIAYMIGIIRLNDNEDVQKAVDILKKSVDPNRWICVVPDSVIIDSNQNVIIVIMDEKNNADTIHNNFENIK